MFTVTLQRRSTRQWPETMSGRRPTDQVIFDRESSDHRRRRGLEAVRREALALQPLPQHRGGERREVLLQSTEARQAQAQWHEETTPLQSFEKYQNRERAWKVRNGRSREKPRQI